MRKILIIFSLLLCPLFAHADIAFDASSTGSITGGGTGTFTQVVTSSANTILFVSGDTNGVASSTSATYNGVAMTLISSISGNGVESQSFLLCLIAPDAGSHSIVVTSPSASGGNLEAASYAGVNQSCTMDYSSKGTTAGSQSSLTVHASTTAANSWTYWFNSHAGAGQAGAGSRLVTAAGGNNTFDSGTAIVSPGDYSMTATANNNKWLWMIVAFSPASSPASASPPERFMWLESCHDSTVPFA